jgi:hypothetical protein
MAEPEKVVVAVPVPNARVLKGAALVCFLVDVVGGIWGIGVWWYPVLAFGFALWVAGDIAGE